MSTLPYRINSFPQSHLHVIIIKLFGIVIVALSCKIGNGLTEHGGGILRPSIGRQLAQLLLIYMVHMRVNQRVGSHLLPILKLVCCSKISLGKRVLGCSVAEKDVLGLSFLSLI